MTGVLMVVAPRSQLLTPEGEGGGGHATLSCSMRM